MTRISFRAFASFVFVCIAACGFAAPIKSPGDPMRLELAAPITSWD